MRLAYKKWALNIAYIDFECMAESGYTHKHAQTCAHTHTHTLSITQENNQKKQGLLNRLVGLAEKEDAAKVAAEQATNKESIPAVSSGSGSGGGSEVQSDASNGLASSAADRSGSVSAAAHRTDYAQVEGSTAASAARGSSGVLTGSIGGSTSTAGVERTSAASGSVAGGDKQAEAGQGVSIGGQVNGVGGVMVSKSGGVESRSSSTQSSGKEGSHEGPAVGPVVEVDEKGQLRQKVSVMAV